MGWTLKGRCVHGRSVPHGRRQTNSPEHHASSKLMMTLRAGPRSQEPWPKPTVGVRLAGTPTRPSAEVQPPEKRCGRERRATRERVCENCEADRPQPLRTTASLHRITRLCNNRISAAGRLPKRAVLLGHSSLLLFSAARAAVGVILTSCGPPPKLLVPCRGPFYLRCPFRLLRAIFSMLCTRQYSRHCVPTFSLPRRVKRSSRLVCRILANTGSTVAMR